MEINNKRLSLLLKFIDIALVLIVLSVIFSLGYSAHYANKFAQLSDRLPSSNKFDGIRSSMSIISYLAMSKVIVYRVFLAIILFAIRKIVKSILLHGAFQQEHAEKIRKIAIYFMCFAGLLLFFNLILMLAAFNKGNNRVLAASILSLISIFENYVLTSLIAFGIAEVFTAGMKLKQEQELTI